MKRRALLAVAAWLAAAPASGTLVPVDVLAPGDALATRDTATALEWLDLDQTTGLSLDDFAIGAGGWLAAGWRLADTSEVCGLIGTHAAPITPCPNDSVLDVAPAPEIGELIELLGVTMPFESERQPGLPATGTVGFFLPAEGDVGLAGVLDPELAYLIYNLPNRAMVFAADFGPSPAWRDSLYGLFLVREVPEPASLPLLAAGCAALAALARRGRSA